MNRKWSTN